MRSDVFSVLRPPAKPKKKKKNDYIYIYVYSRNEINSPTGSTARTFTYILFRGIRKVKKETKIVRNIAVSEYETEKPRRGVYYYRRRRTTESRACCARIHSRLCIIFFFSAPSPYTGYLFPFLSVVDPSRVSRS